MLMLTLSAPVVPCVQVTITMEADLMGIPTFDDHVFPTVAMDGTIPDVVQSLAGEHAMRNGDVFEWGCRALMNFGRISGGWR